MAEPQRFTPGMTIKLGPPESDNNPPLPDGITPADTGDNSLPDGITPVSDNYEGAAPQPFSLGGTDTTGFNPAGDYLKVHKNQPSFYTGSAHREAPKVEPEKSDAENIWTELNRPHLDLTGIANKGADIVTNPDNNYFKPTGKGDWRDKLAQTESMVRGFGGGAVQGAGNLLTGMSSDLGLATLPAYLEGGAAGESIANAAKAFSPVAKAAGAAFAVEGAHNLTDPTKTAGERLAAIPQIAGGVAPFLHAPTPTKPTELGPEPTAPTPEPQREPQQQNFFRTDENGRIQFSKSGQTGIANPADEFYQRTFNDLHEPFTSSAQQQQLGPEAQPEPKTQGNLDLEPGRPTIADRFQETSLFPQGHAGGLNEDMEAPPDTSNAVITTNTPKDVVDSIPDHPDGKSKVSPFPKADDDVLDQLIRNKQIDYDNPTLQDVPLHNLVGTQDSINPDIVKDYIDKGERTPLTEVPPQNKGRMDSQAPVVVQVGDDNILAGGHHRATADLASGKDSMQAVVYKANVPPELLDKFKASLEADRAGRTYPESTSTETPTAKFAFHQDDFNGGSFPMYNVEGGPLDKSTVSADTLRENGIEVPEHEQDFSGDIEPSHAATESGGVRIGQNLERTAQEVTSGYSRQLPAIMFREAFQNARDAVEGLGTGGKIHTNVTPKGFSISDNGKGMNRQQLQTVFSNLFESGKAEDPNASGGKGIGKATYMLGGKNFTVTTVHEAPDGQKVELQMSGTPKQLMEGVDVKERKVPKGTPTYTRVQTAFTDAQIGENAHGHALAMQEDIMNNSRGLKAQVTPNGRQEVRQWQDTNQDKPILETNINGSKVSAALPPNQQLGTRSYINMHVANNGLYQYSERIYIGNDVPDVPENVVVNVEPSAKEGSPEYPFPTQRESMKESEANELQDALRKAIAEPQLNKRKATTQQLYDEMMGNAQATGGARKTIIYDPGHRFTPEEMNDVAANPAMQNVNDLFDIVADDALKATGQTRWQNRLEGIGTMFDREGSYGLHVPNPGAKEGPGAKSSIMVNWLAHVAENPADPYQAAWDTIGTIMHELGHVGYRTLSHDVSLSDADKANPALGKFMEMYLENVAHGGMTTNQGHAADWLARTAEVMNKYGVDNTLKAVGDLHDIYTGRPGGTTGHYRGEPDVSTGPLPAGFSPEVNELLRLFTERSGRSETTPDYLSPTGLKSESTSRTGTNTESSDASSTQESTAPSDTAKTLTDAFNRPIVWSKTANATDTTAPTSFSNTATKDAATINNIKQTIPQSDIPNRIRNINDHYEEAKANGVTTDEDENLLSKMHNLQRSLLTSWNLHAPFRQGLSLIWNPEWWKAWEPMLQAYGSEGAYRTVMDSIENDPSGYFKPQPRILKNGEISDAMPRSFANQAGLQLTDTLANREEVFRSKWAEQYFPGTRRSVRAYTAYLNKLRAGVFTQMVDAAGAAGDLDKARKIADYINVATGRGNLGDFEGGAKGLTHVFFSPRKMASDIQMMSRTFNPRFYAQMPEGTRLYQLKSALSLAGAGLAMGQLAKSFVPGADVEYNPTSTDFGKIKFGNTRIDPFGGHQQYIVAMAKILSGQTTSSYSNKTTQLNQPKFGSETGADVANRFIENRLAPIPSLVWSWMAGKEFDGTPFDAKTALLKRTAPLVAQDIYELWKQNPDIVPMALASGAATVGMGVQTYGR